jgi:hypothetical protein
MMPSSARERALLVAAPEALPDNCKDNLQRQLLDRHRLSVNVAAWVPVCRASFEPKFDGRRHSSGRKPFDPSILTCYTILREKWGFNGQWLGYFGFF